jgi:hypothetical protein
VPIVAPNPTAPYDTLETILNVARIRVMDAYKSLSGEVFTDTGTGAPWITYQSVIAAWRRLQDFLFANGFKRFEDYSILYNCPSVATSDTGVFQWVDWSQFFDGANYFPAGGGAPVLPPLFITPLEVRERPNGTTGSFLTMDKPLKGGLPAVPKKGWNSLWEWRNDALYLIGPTVATDLFIRYQSYLPDFIPGPIVNGNPTVNGNQLVPITRCLDPLANYIAYEFCAPRGDMDAQAFLTMAEAAAFKMLRRDTMEEEATYKSSEMNKMRDSYTPQATQPPSAPVTHQ